MNEIRKELKMEKYRVVILDTISPDTKVEEETLKDINADLFLSPSPDEDITIQYVSDADALVQDAAPVTEEILGAAKRCKIVAELGIGVNNIDIPAATKRGIYVTNVPDFCFDEVSDHTIALMLALVRKINVFDRKVRRGQWGLGEVKPMFRLKGQTYGVFGFGNIGRATAKKAQAFGFKVIATDPFVSLEEAKKLRVEMVDFNMLLQISDVISIHAPLLESTRHVFNAETIGKMRDTAYLVNVARGGLVDQKALHNALKSKRIAGAALDVMEKEPPPAMEPLLALDNVIITPHAAYYSETSYIEVRKKALEEVVRVLKGGQPKNWLNRKEMSEKR